MTTNAREEATALPQAEFDALMDHIHEYGTMAEGITQRARAMCVAYARAVLAAADGVAGVPAEWPPAWAERFAKTLLMLKDSLAERGARPETPEKAVLWDEAFAVYMQMLEWATATPSPAQPQPAQGGSDERIAALERLAEVARAEGAEKTRELLSWAADQARAALSALGGGVADSLLFSARHRIAKRAGVGVTAEVNAVIAATLEELRARPEAAQRREGGEHHG